MVILLAQHYRSISRARSALPPPMNEDCAALRTSLEEALMVNSECLVNKTLRLVWYGRNNYRK